MRKAKIGVVALRMTAGPASRRVSAQAMSVKGIALLRHAWNRKRFQLCRSAGRRSPRQCSAASSTAPAMAVRAAMKVIGGIVSTPSLMKL